jgi:hypothetical protein
MKQTVRKKIGREEERSWLFFASDFNIYKKTKITTAIIMRRVNQ